MCPPPVVYQEAEFEGRTTSSMCEVVKLREEDILVTLRGEEGMIQDEVDVGDVCHHGDDGILYSTVDTTQEKVMTTCPPPVCH